MFAKAPGTLIVSGEDTRLGICSGWVPPWLPAGGEFGYATDDVYYVEVCLFNEICENGAELFDLIDGEPFRCRFSEARLRALQHVLLSPLEPARGTSCKMDNLVLRSCDNYCSGPMMKDKRYACSRWECKGCSFC